MFFCFAVAGWLLLGLTSNRVFVYLREQFSVAFLIDWTTEEASRDYESMVYSIIRIGTRYVLLLCWSLLIVASPGLTITFLKGTTSKFSVVSSFVLFSKPVEAFFMGKYAQDSQAIKGKPFGWLLQAREGLVVETGTRQSTEVTRRWAAVARKWAAVRKKQSNFGRTNGQNKKAPRIGQEANKSSQATQNCLHLSYEATRQGKRSNWQACKNA
jgi:hypothetical protein